MCPRRLLDHLRQQRLRDPEEAQRVDREGGLDLGVGKLQERAAADDAGVVDQDVHGARRGRRLRGDAVDVFAFRHVAVVAARRFRTRSRVLRRTLSSFSRSMSQTLMRPPSRAISQGHQAADPTRAARDHDVSPRDLAHLTPPLQELARRAHAQPPAAAFTNATVSPSRTRRLHAALVVHQHAVDRHRRDARELVEARGRAAKRSRVMRSDVGDRLRALDLEALRAELLAIS